MIQVPIPVPPREVLSALERADRTFLEVIQLAPDTMGSDERALLAMAFTSVALEHYRSIIALCKSSVGIGSALALFRCLTDTIARGEWLYFCATDIERESFMKHELKLDSSPFRNKRPPQKSMADAVDQQLGFVVRLGLYGQFYSQMSDYAHTGHDAVSQRVNAQQMSIEARYPPAQVVALLTQASQVTVLHLEVMCAAVGEDERVRALTQLFQTLKE